MNEPKVKRIKMASQLSNELKEIYCRQLKKMANFERQDVEDYLPEEITNSSAEKLEQEVERKKVAAMSASSAVIRKMKESNESYDEEEEEDGDDDDDDDDDSGISDDHSEMDKTFSNKKKNDNKKDKYQYTEPQIEQFLSALTKNMVFDIGYRVVDKNHKNKCWCPCW
jgi:hypothetical protein